MASNPYMQNPFVAGLGALSQGIQLGEQERAQKAAQQAAMQRQAMLDAAKATLDKSQAGNYDASAEESRARGRSYGVTADNTRRQDLMSEIDKVNQRLPDLYTVAVTRGDRAALDDAIAYKRFLMSQLQGDASPSIPSPTGAGGLGAPSFAGSSPTGGYAGGFSGAPAGIPSPMGGAAGDLGMPSVLAVAPLPPFAQQLQDASKPAPFDINSQFGIPKPVAAPAYVPPKPTGGNPLVTPLDGPPQVQGGVTRYPYRAPSGETLYASRQEAAGVIDWARQQPMQDKIADVELLRKTGKTSENDGWSPYYVQLAQSLSGKTPQEREQQFEAAITRDNKPIVKFPSDSQSYQNFAARNGVDTGQPAPPDIPQAPQQGQQGGLTFSPGEQLQMAQTDEAKARARETNQKALKASIENGDPMPVISAIGMRSHQEQTLMAQEANANYERNGVPIHIPVPGVDFNGYYSPDVKTAADVARLVADTHKTNVDAMLEPYKLREEQRHNIATEGLTGRGQDITANHYGAQDTIAGEKFNYQKDQGFKNNPDTQKKIASYTSQITSLQTAIDKANQAQAAAVASTTLTPQARQIILKTQDDIKRDALTKQQVLKNKIDTIGQTQQQGASNYGNLPTNPLAPSYIDKAIQDCKATGAGSGGHCDRLARISTEKTDPVNARYFDRSPGATALTTLANFQKAGKAFPLKPGMSLPPGTLVFSTTLGKGAGPRGTNAGHVAMIGSDGQPNDQHAKNQIALGKFDYFVPPSGSAPRNAPRGNQNTASGKGRAIKVGGKTFTVEM